MTVRELITLLSTLPAEMPVGTANYYGDFGPVIGANVETAEESSTPWRDNAKYAGTQVVCLSLDLDMQ